MIGQSGKLSEIAQFALKEKFTIAHGQGPENRNYSKLNEAQICSERANYYSPGATPWVKECIKYLQALKGCNKFNSLFQSLCLFRLICSPGALPQANLVRSFGANVQTIVCFKIALKGQDISAQGQRPG